MPDLHPHLTSFPFVLVFVAAISEIIWRWKRIEVYKHTARFCLTLAVLFAPLAYASGYLAGDVANLNEDAPTDDISNHQVWGVISLILLAVTVILRKAAEKAKFGQDEFYVAYIVVLGLTLLFFGYASFLGGELVFTHGVGVAAK